MIQAMYNGISGLQAHRTEMDVISDNIANINTIGFKSSRVSFKQMLTQTIKEGSGPRAGGAGGTNAMQIGLGTSIGSIEVNQTQGSLLPTGKPTDLAIEGNGFLLLGDGEARFYTRDGSFQLDGDGNLVAAGSGLKVLGWTADPSTGVVDDAAPISAASSISIPVGRMSAARQTENVTYRGNLDAQMAAGGIYSTTVAVYDSLGASHRVTVTFTKTANDGEWSWEASSPDAVVGSTLGSGTIVFDENGQSSGATGSLALTLADSKGATNPIDAQLSFSQMTQLSGQSSASPESQDGLPFGVLQSFIIDKDGVISGRFTNGLSKKLGCIALAQFSNPAGLTKAGNNLLLESANSGLPQVGKPSTGGLGSTSSGFLESSNVDLPTEFASMIVAQRGFQASSRIITTSDEILQELVQLKR